MTGVFLLRLDAKKGKFTENVGFTPERDPPGLVYSS